jgi:hypothetical protein
MSKYPTPDGDGLEPLVRELKDIRTQLRDLQRPSGTNIGNTANQVQLQVAYLASLKTLTASDEAVEWEESPFVPFVESGAAITVTTTEDLVARVSYAAQVFVSPMGGTSAGSGSYYYGRVALDGAAIGLVNSGGISGSAGALLESEFPYLCERIVTVPAGTHVFTHEYRAFAWAASGGYTSGDRSIGTLVVQFIGRPEGYGLPSQ